MRTRNPLARTASPKPPRNRFPVLGGALLALDVALLCYNIYTYASLNFAMFTVTVVSLEGVFLTLVLGKRDIVHLRALLWRRLAHVVLFGFAVIGLLLITVPLFKDREAGTTGRGVHRALKAEGDTFRLRVQSSPPGASILVDSISMGVTNLLLHLGKGEHVVEMSKVGYKTFRQIVDVPDDTMLSAILDLE